ncbi:SNF2-related protein [Streptococcus ruminantium]|uniref:SNF2-related protein n=1 Tax=Streptococcus ruminantium TaxID=1917441 RepID=UPI0012DDA6DE|nr:DEAD/DEAH box helicase [Streptococcus ruminantium]
MTLTTEQVEAFEKFSRLKVGALFMKQGTGKTRVALELIKSTNADFVLFLCPYSTKANLLAEIEKWGLDRSFEIVGYETVSNSDRKYLELLSIRNKYSKVFIVADESVFIKNDASKRYSRILRLRDLSEYRLILNGTPITKDEWDIYNQMEFLSPKIFDMHRHEFLNTFFKKISFKKRGMPAREFYKLSNVNLEYLHKIIEPYIFESDFKFENKISEKTINIPASKSAIDIYRERKELLLKSLENGQSFIEQFTNLAVACFDDKERHKVIAKQLKGQVIAFCSLLSEVKHINEEIDCYVITGATAPQKRLEIIKQFKKDDKPLIMTYGTGAFGLNLQFCHRIAFLSLTFDYAKIDQAMSRIKRIGQENDIEYTYFTSNLGIYNMIKDNIVKKQTLKELIIDKIEKGENFEKIL